MSAVEVVHTIHAHLPSPLEGEGLGERGSRASSLLLPNGTHIRAQGLGQPTTTSGELVFTTAMTGYEEALTDPSYRGQILLFTYPLIGNYARTPGRAQSGEIQARAIIVSTRSNAWSARQSLREYLLANSIPTMFGVDTRMLAQWVREHGAQPAALAIHDPDAADSQLAPDLRNALAASDYDRADLISETTVTRPEIHGHGQKRLIALLDCGNKRSVIDELVHRDSQVVVLPASTSASDILTLRPDGVVISNGPGNPETAG